LDNPPEGERYERFEAQRRELGEHADQLVGAAQEQRPTEALNED
jgi:hypothetical protein